MSAVSEVEMTKFSSKMGRKGYKGICEIGVNLYLINDDGHHVIVMCKVNEATNSCECVVIAGQRGHEGIKDDPIGTQALISRPGR